MIKKISFSIPCYNEVENVIPLAEAILNLFAKKSLKQYKCSIEFIDNKSTDGTRKNLEYLCKKYPDHVRAIFNARNFGGVSNYYGIYKQKEIVRLCYPATFRFL